ncbi:hypothetical protein GCM10027169_15720 [Gordonia jinhuaensis]|uniref:Uncharacterized protein n=1 Tax=Gordonia jinhuaensis TaxID=1517702 RepID=A0A916TK53_9ACTN|nr:hypothetical protein [Gordonia jinhuaensis]GGB49127.1 hypothetical protein GCM10011489_40060 [Gordonia jinhuaensis]
MNAIDQIRRAVSLLEQIIDLLEQHGERTALQGLRSAAKAGEAGITDDGPSPPEAAAEARRRLQSIGRAYTDIVLKPRPPETMHEVNTHFDELRGALARALTAAERGS